MTPRQIVGARIADAMAAVLEQAWKDAGRWPLNRQQRRAVQTMREDMVAQAAGIHDDGIARLLTAPAGEIDAIVRAEIEPYFRREIAGDLLS